MNPTERFTGRAGDYAKGRPSYPEAAVDALFDGLGDPKILTVVDLGAGTGISSRLLAARGPKVIAVEPNEAMLQQAAGSVHGNTRLSWLKASAESSGLATASADLVTVFQAFHWFDHQIAIGEMVRILRPGGRAALVYNERDEDDSFTAAYANLVRRYATDDTEATRSEARRVFGAHLAWKHIRILEFPNSARLKRDGLRARVHSTSYLPKEGAAAEELHIAMDALFDTYANDGKVTVHMKTIVVCADTAKAHAQA